MATNILSIIQSILALLVFSLGITSIIYLAGWLIGKAITLLFKSIFKITISEAWQNWWFKYKEQIISVWEFLSEVIIDPAFYVLGLYALATRMESIIENTRLYPQYSFWKLLEYDMENDMNFYMAFLVIFFFWMMWRGWKHRQDMRFKKDMANSLKAINSKLDKLNEHSKKERTIRYARRYKRY